MARRSRVTFKTPGGGNSFSPPEDFDEVRVSGEELCVMVAVSNFFDDESNDVEYRSLNHVARRFSQSSNPEKTLKRLLSKMQLLRFFVINERDRLVFDSAAFDAFVDGHRHGQQWWVYFGNHATFVRTQ